MNIFKKSVMDRGLLSVIIPSYNHEKFIGNAIKSVLNQDYSNLELIIVDDGSKDKSVDIIKSIKDERINLICQENKGAHNAINEGLKVAKGEYLAILNSDDLFEKNRFSVMIEELSKQKNAEFICSYIQIIDENGKKLGEKKGWLNMEPWQLSHPELTYKNTSDFRKNLLMGNFISTTSNFLFTRSLYNRIGGMRNLRFAHDWDFALRAALETDCMMVEKPLMQYRIHNNNTISSNRKWMLFEIIWMWATYIPIYAKKNIILENDMEMISLLESIQTQGNDKLLWSIMTYIQARREQGVEHPEEVFLDDANYREKLLNYIKE
jgi:glycosyltransferase involved in cell wall biosynthesis